MPILAITIVLPLGEVIEVGVDTAVASITAEVIIVSPSHLSCQCLVSLKLSFF